MLIKHLPSSESATRVSFFPHPLKKPIRNFILGGVVAGVVIGLIFHSSFDFHLMSVQRMAHLVDLARSNLWISIGFYCFYVLGVMALPITMFPIVGGVLFPFWLAFPLNVLAATLGAWLSFGVTRTFGRHAVEPYLRGKIKSWDKITARQGFKAVLILRLVGVPPFIVSNYALGFSGVNNFDFLLGTSIGILPWMGIVTYLANSLWAAVLVGGRQGLAKALFEALGPLTIVSAMILTAIAVNILIQKRRHSNL